MLSKPFVASVASSTPDWSLVKTPAIDAAVWLTLLFNHHSDALGEGVGAFLITLNDTLIFVGKLDWPPSFRN